MINPLNLHYSFNNPASIHDEEALTALELAGRQGAKINEVVKNQNELRQETENHLEEQDNRITKMNDETMPSKVKSEVQSQITKGTFDKQINYYIGNLEERVDNLVENIPEGSTTMDAEVVDIRVLASGEVKGSAGDAVRYIDRKYAQTHDDLYKKLLPKRVFLSELGSVLADGRTSTDASCIRTDFIPCEGFNSLTYKTNMAHTLPEVAFYDKNKNFLSGVSVMGRESFTENTIDISGSGASFMIISAFLRTDIGVNYDTCYGYLHNKNIAKEINDVNEKQDALEYEVHHKVIPLNVPLNIVGGLEKTGYPNTDMGCVRTDYTELGDYKYLKYKTNYADFTYEVGFYDENKVFLESVSIKGHGIFGEYTVDISTVPAKYFIVCGYIREDIGATADSFYCNLCTEDTVDYSLTKKTVTAEKFLIFGDSITCTAQISEDGTSYIEGAYPNWVTHIPEFLPKSSIKNYACAGAHYADFNTDVFYQKLTNQISVATSDKSNDDSTIIVLALGTNDGGQTEIDTYEEAINTPFSNLDKTKFCQAVRYAMCTLKNKYPKAKCFVCTPIQRADREPMPEITENIKKMGNRYNFIVLDCESECGIVRDFETFGEAGRYLIDGLHTNSDGKKLMAEYICNGIKQHL